MPRRITNVTARFNIEARPFQHVRVEVAAVICKDDDADEVRKELVTYAKGVCDDILAQVYQTPSNRWINPPPLTSESDELPYPENPPPEPTSDY